MDCVMDQSIPNRRFMNMTALRIVNKKRKITAMLVGIIFQIFMQLKNMIFKIYLKFSYIAFAGLFFFEFGPSIE